MQKRIRYIISVTSIVLFISNSIIGQDINIFGFFQGMAMRSDLETATYSPYTGSKVAQENHHNNISLQQANLLFNANIGKGFSAFVNLELTNNYSSNKNWGTFNLQEVYLTYSSGQSFKVKGGLFIPKFNSLYEIYNRSPLLPYILRPIIYEPSFWGIIEPEDFLPARAMAQVFGAIKAGKTKIDYAAFFGSSEDSYRSSDRSPNSTTEYPIPGWEYSKFATVGARLGLRYSKLNFGVSTTYDRDNLNDINIGFISSKNRSLGDVPRIRLGIDLEYSIANFTLTGELISVMYSLTQENEDSLKIWSQPVLPGVENSYTIGDNLDKRFYYVTLQYDFLDQFFVYGTISNLTDNRENLLSSDHGGFNQYSFGGGYKPIETVVLKFQYASHKVESDIADYTNNAMIVGVSVSF